ncbi:unnamed protein product [Closterium sp. Yama58-4]|nr:unnamed protein product [Closterium sp. Yama58-4]
MCIKFLFDKTIKFEFPRASCVTYTEGSCDPTAHARTLISFNAVHSTGHMNSHHPSLSSGKINSTSHVLTALQPMADADVAQLCKKLEELEMAVHNAREEAKAKAQKAEELQKSLAAAEEDNSELQTGWAELNRQRLEAEEAAAKLKSETARLEREVEERHMEAVRLRAEVEEGRRAVEESKKAAVMAARERKARELEWVSQISRLQSAAQTSSMAKLQLVAESASSKQRCERLEEEKKAVERQRDRVDDEKKALLQQLKDLQERGTGPASGSAATEEALQKAQAELAAAHKAVEEERQAGEEAVAQCAQLEAQCRDLEEQLSQAQSKLKEAKEAAQENGAQDSAMLAMLNLPESDARVQLMEALASLEQEKRKSNSFCMQQIELRIKAKKLQDELRASDVPALKQEVASLQDELAQAKALLDKAEEEKEELLGRLQEAEAVGNSAMQAEVEHVRGENNMLMQQLDMLAMQFDQEKNLIHAHMAQKEEEVADMKLRLADERQEREEAQRRLEESERRREAVKGEMEAMEQQAFKMRQSMVHMQRQITECAAPGTSPWWATVQAEHSPGRLYVEALEEQHSKVAQLEQQVAEKGQAEQQLQQLQATMAAADAQMKEREAQVGWDEEKRFSCVRACARAVVGAGSWRVGWCACVTQAHLQITPAIPPPLFPPCSPQPPTRLPFRPLPLRTTAPRLSAPVQLSSELASNKAAKESLLQQLVHPCTPINIHAQQLTPQHCFPPICQIDQPYGCLCFSLSPPCSATLTHLVSYPPTLLCPFCTSLVNNPLLWWVGAGGDSVSPLDMGARSMLIAGGIEQGGRAGPAQANACAAAAAEGHVHVCAVPGAGPWAGVEVHCARLY